MNFISTRNSTPPTPIDTALSAGLAPDGGLYVPERIPSVMFNTPPTHLAESAYAMLAPYFGQSALCEQLPAICEEAFSFDAPIRPIGRLGNYLLELFHGPTAAFKDYAARFLARALDALRAPDAPPTTILVATSGDTGAAVAAAFHRHPGFNVVILYPDGNVSPRQAHGLGCWGDNVHAFRVNGSFDDCQQLVKHALSDTTLRAQLALGSANSISLGRLLPQAAYYAHSAARHQIYTGHALNFIIPTGNLGNACAAVIARKMLNEDADAPIIGEIRLACNANDTLPRYFAGADYTAQPTRATLANAMDVGAPSNFERLRHWYASDAELRAGFFAESVDDATITQVLREAPERHGMVACPHTATALKLLQDLRLQGDTRDWAVVATAHPAKFEQIVEPLVGHPIEPPAALAQSLARPAQAVPLDVDYAALVQQLRLIGHA